MLTKETKETCQKVKDIVLKLTKAYHEHAYEEKGKRIDMNKEK